MENETYLRITWQQHVNSFENFATSATPTRISISPNRKDEKRYQMKKFVKKGKGVKNEKDVNTPTGMCTRQLRYLHPTRRRNYTKHRIFTQSNSPTTSMAFGKSITTLNTLNMLIKHKPVLRSISAFLTRRVVFYPKKNLYLYPPTGGPKNIPFSVIHRLRFSSWNSIDIRPIFLSVHARNVSNFSRPF